MQNQIIAMHIFAWLHIWKTSIWKTSSALKSFTQQCTHGKGIAYITIIRTSNIQTSNWFEISKAILKFYEDLYRENKNVQKTIVNDKFLTDLCNKTRNDGEGVKIV